MKWITCMLMFVVLTLSATAGGPLQKRLDKAAKDGAVVFLVVTEKGNSEEGKARGIANSAKSQHRQSMVLTLDRSDPSNAELVKKWALGSVPLPVILVIAGNGVLAGGQLATQASAATLSAMVPTRAKSQVLKELQNGNAVFLVVSTSAEARAKAMKSCELACGNMGNKAKTVHIRFTDPEEQNFLKELRISNIGEEAVTYVINSGGQVTGTFTGGTDAKTLVAAATKKVASGCCPTGSGKSCN
ncbi:MAG: hypothetical protein KFF77_08475 [Bacteroidetes bacterium]|nr:hypothetical protein [Bacteroidota bacterium]